MSIQLNSASDQTLIDTIGVPLFDETDERELEDFEFEFDNQSFSVEFNHLTGVVFSSDEGNFVIFNKLEDGSVKVEFQQGE